MPGSRRTSPLAAAAGILALALFLAPAVSYPGEEDTSDIPSSLAIKLNRVRKALPADKVSAISKLSAAEQWRYLLYVDMIGKLPDKLYEGDTVEKLVPAEDLAVVKNWPEDDQRRIAVHFKKNRPEDHPELTDEELKAGLAKLEDEVAAMVRLMLPSEQKSYIAVRVRIEAKRKTAAGETQPTAPDTPAAPGSGDASAGAKGLSGTCKIGIAAAICLLATVIVVLNAKKKS